MKCDFCEFEDNVTKPTKYKHPDGWIAVQVNKKYNVLHACPKCARILMICTYMANNTEVRDGEVLKKYFPNLKRKDDTDD